MTHKVLYIGILSTLFYLSTFFPHGNISIISYQVGLKSTKNVINENYFQHGVASGDPLPNQVIIWTRITTEKEKVSVNWKMATDKGMRKVVAEGIVPTDERSDYTVKVDVMNLESDVTYYYQFMIDSQKSIIGKTKTISNNPDDLKFAIVSCSNYEQGYFSTYSHIAKRENIDAVLHLGDYIYEYKSGKYGNKKLVKEGKRVNAPLHEIVTLKDYRERYAKYRTDKDLMALHQNHPMICVWDDHETANNSYKDGAQNHQSKKEGDWESRKNAGVQAYMEWLPIREKQNKSIYRNFEFGDFAELIMLDTRLHGRDKQEHNVKSDNFKNPNRTMLGKEQLDWFLEKLKNSDAQWKIIGQQVIFAPLNSRWLSPFKGNKVEGLFMDMWNGYPFERQKIIDFIKEHDIKNVIFVTGDIHSSFAFDICVNPTDETLYNSKTGEGAVAVEFTTPSVTSANFDEIVNEKSSDKFENCYLGPCDDFPFRHKDDLNPHLKYIDLKNHGYFILNLDKKKAKADYFYVKTIVEPDAAEYLDASLEVISNQPGLKKK